MKSEIENWWMDYNLPVSEVIRIGRRNNPQLTKAAMQTAIEQVYNENKTGLTIPRHRLAWTAWEYARQIDASKNRDDHVKKYEGERKELTKLRVKKIANKTTRRLNIKDLAIFHLPYWAVIIALVMLFHYLYLD